MDIIRQYRGLSRSVYIVFLGKTITSMGAFIWPLLILILSRKIGYTTTDIAKISVVIGVIFIKIESEDSHLYRWEMNDINILI